MKRNNLILTIVLVVSVGLFAAYQAWIHNNLDNQGPVITIEEAILEISVSDEEQRLFEGITAMDDRDGDVTGTMLVEQIYGITEENLTTVVYAAFDRAGNVSKAERQVRIVDYESPRFTLSGSLTFAAGSGFDVLEYVGAEDVRDGDIQRRVHPTLISDTGSVSDVGRHTIRFQVTNSLGDTSELDLPLVVYDALSYTASVELKEYLIYLDQGDRFWAEDYLQSFFVRGKEYDLRYRIPEGIGCEITGSVNTQVPGVYEVSYVLSMDVGMDTFSGLANLIVVVTD